jgi:hypothetical protein
MMVEDVAQLMELREKLQGIFGSESAGDKVIEIFQKWKDLDAEHHMNNRLLRRFATRVSGKTIMLSKMLGIAEEMTNLLDELKRSLNLGRFAMLTAILTPVGMGEAPRELVSFGEILLETAIEFVVNSPYFALGIVKGACQSVEDLVTSLGDIAVGLWEVVQDPPKLVEHGKELVEVISELDLKALGQEFLNRWSDPNPKERAEFQGFVIGYIEMEILFLVLTKGGGTAAKAGRFAKLLEILSHSKKAHEIVGKIKPVAKVAQKTAGMTAEVASGAMGALGATIEDEQQESTQTQTSVEDGRDPYLLIINEADGFLGDEAGAASEVQRTIQRTPQPGVKAGLEGEKQIMDKLLKGEIPDMPKMQHVVSAAYNGVNGVDIIGVEIRRGERIIHVIEVKGGFESDLKDTLHHGFQMSNEWVRKVMKKALANPDVAKELFAVSKIKDPERLLNKIVDARRWVVASAGRRKELSLFRIRKNKPKAVYVPAKRRKRPKVP